MNDWQDDDFGREEDLFRQALARHAKDLADEPVAYEGPRERRRVSTPARWLAVAATVSLIGGSGYWYLTRQNVAMPGPSASSAIPSMPTASPSASRSTASNTPSPSTGKSPSQRPSVTVPTHVPSATPSTTASGPTTTAPSPASSSTPTASMTPSASAVPSRGTAAPSTGPTGPTGPKAPTTTATAAAPSATPSETELGDYNPNDPTPAPADRIGIGTPVTFAGWGPYVLGASQTELTRRKLVVPETELCEGSVGAITAHKTVGLHATDFGGSGLYSLVISNPMVKTDKGAGAGMTMAQVAKLYGGQFAYEPKASEYGKPITMARARQGNHEIIFVAVNSQQEYVSATPKSIVDHLVVRSYADYLPYQDAC
ncbi:hypothetical protein AAEX63_00565 [Luteococcus sp. H138]|uniref:hypothetical protein n=1 Tax=unclassified Luteococcus TaxID=2639923 RepID=UPI00313F18AC